MHSIPVREVEDLAARAVSEGDFSTDAILSVLRHLDVLWNRCRRNVVPCGREGVNGMLFGMFGYGGKVGVTAASKKYPWACKLMTGYPRKANPGLEFTSA